MLHSHRKCHSGRVGVLRRIASQDSLKQSSVSGRYGILQT
jgi:hypothetical protein